jgi:hypothetical protein
MRRDVEKVTKYLEEHSGRLDIDIKNAQKKGNELQVNFYDGAKSATDIAVMLLKDILKRNEIGLDKSKD